MRWSSVVLAVVLAVVLVVCLAMGLVACSHPVDKAPSAATIPTGCGNCDAELADLVRTLEEVAGVTTVTSTRRTTRAVPQAHLSIGVTLAGEDVVSTDIRAVIDAVAEAAWHSDVTPLDVLSLDLELPNGYQESDHYRFGADRDTYAARWGDRPTGSEWSPVPPDRSEAGGCERDGCEDLMRDLAREASALPGVEAVLAAHYVSSSPTNAASADVAVRTDGTDVSEAIAEIVWRSRVAPITLIDVTAVVPAGGFPESTSFQIDPDHGQDHDRLEQLWGRRPAAE